VPSATHSTAQPSASARDWRAIDWPAYERTSEVAGARMSYVDIGRGEPAVLFVHGLAAQWRVWLANIPAVSEHRRVIAVDLPGFGASAMPVERISVEGYAEVLEGLCEQLGLGSVVVVGNSMGGFIAAELALRRPGRVERLMLVDAAGIVPTRRELLRVLPVLRAEALIGGRLAATPRSVAARPRLRRAVLGAVVHDPGRIPADFAYYALLAPPGPGTPEGLKASLSYLSYDWGERLRQIRCPTLVMWGDGDTIIPIRHAWEFAARIPHAQVVVFEQSGHLPMAEHPERFNRVLLDFIGEDTDEPEKSNKLYNVSG
jgi:pimeloyl-ACP methyl ester carboxylesterase